MIMPKKWHSVKVKLIRSSHWTAGEVEDPPRFIEKDSRIYIQVYTEYGYRWADVEKSQLPKELEELVPQPQPKEPNLFDFLD